MPSRNIVKVYVKDGYYHIYNRGIEKRTIFKDEQDYKIFLKYIKESLSPPSVPKDLIKTFNVQGATLTFKGYERQVKNFNNQIKLLAYCLMPNHFHFLIKQDDEKAISKFMQSLITRYSMYFNKKYNRVGKLFQGHYKAVLITDEAYLLHLSRYIHLNPSEYTNDLINAHSSYAEYLGKRNTSWVSTAEILSFFNNATKDFIKAQTYKDFVEKSKIDSASILGKSTLED